MHNAFVSIISVHFNQLQLTEAFIESVLQQQYSNYELIVVDNGSKQEPISPIIDKFPTVAFIISETNLGFAGGNNLGIEKAKGEYLLFLNNDTIVSPEMIGGMVNHFKKHPKCGMLSPKIKYHETNIIQYAGSGDINLYTGRNKRIGYKQNDTGQYDLAYPTEIIHGAALMVSRNLIEKIGPMPELFFLYYEEIDWCEQAKKAGFEVWYSGFSTVYHKESMSIGKNSPLKTYYMVRNRLLFMRRHTTGLKKLSWIIFFIILSIPKNILVYILKRDWSNLSSFMKGIKWNLLNNHYFI